MTILILNIMIGLILVFWSFIYFLDVDLRIYLIELTEEEYIRIKEFTKQIKEKIELLKLVREVIF
jgi:hypothetical protein